MKEPSLFFKGRMRLPLVFWLSAVISSALVSFSVACRLPTLDQLNYTRQEPRKSDLVGVWVPDESSLQAMRQKGGYDTSVQTKLVLKGDGTYELSSMPDWWSNDFGESRKGFENYAGNWTVSKFGDKFWTVSLKSLSGTRLPGTRFANLIGQSPPYRVDFIIGDADENNSMIFIRQ
jgi:hypothetical protein